MPSTTCCTASQPGGADWSYGSGSSRAPIDCARIDRSSSSSSSQKSRPERHCHTRSATPTPTTTQVAAVATRCTDQRRGGNPGSQPSASRAALRSISRSASTIRSMSPSKVMVGFHASFSRALLASPISRSTSAGRKNRGSCST